MGLGVLFFYEEGGRGGLADFLGRRTWSSLLAHSCPPASTSWEDVLVHFLRLTTGKIKTPAFRD